MTALQAPVRPVVAILPGPGWCTPCAAAGERRPAADPYRGSACRDHLRLLPARPPLPGQPTLFDVERVSRLLQAEYPTGVRVACSPCAAAGRDELGMPNRVEGDPTPLCLECWRRRERQAGRRGQDVDAEDLVEWVAELPAGCAACGADEPVEGCWLCGWSWLADLRAEHELQAELEQAAADAERAAVDAEFARIAAREKAAQRVAWLTGWADRVRNVLAAYAELDARGAPVSGRWGRAVELLADVLAREAACRLPGRGRPSVFPVVAAVMAVDADFRSGRRAMPGRGQCAELAGVCERAVYSAWRHGVAIGAWIRTTPGRHLTLEQRQETGRARDRAVYDLRPVHRSTDPAARDAMVPAALRVLDEVLGWAMHLLAGAQLELDRHDRAVEGTGRATSAEQVVVRAERIRQRQIVARTRNAATVLAEHLNTSNKCTPHGVLIGECVSSCLRGLSFTFVDRADVRARTRPRRGRGKGHIGASRSPMKSGLADLESRGSVVARQDGAHPVSRPRTPHAADGTSPARRTTRKRRAPEWASWAYPLAYELRKHWTWLRYQPVHQVAGTLGSRLGPRWTAAAVVDLVEQDRAGRALPVDIHSPVSLLQELLGHALTDEGVQPPFPARLHTEYQQRLAEVRRSASVAAAETRRAAHTVAAAAHATGVQATAALHAAGGGGLAAARAAAAAARGPVRRQAVPGPVDVAQMAAARAELDARRAASRTEDGPDGWPRPAEPGSGPRRGTVA
jgi:hypothetical protein